VTDISDDECLRMSLDTEVHLIRVIRWFVFVVSQRTKSVVLAAETVPSQDGGYRPLWATPSRVSLNYSSGDEDNDPRAAFRPTSANLSRKKDGLSSRRSARDPPSTSCH